MWRVSVKTISRRLQPMINAAKPDLIEVNLSCPNIPGKPQIGYDAEASERLLKRVRKLITVPMGSSCLRTLIRPITQ